MIVFLETHGTTIILPGIRDIIIVSPEMHDMVIVSPPMNDVSGDTIPETHNSPLHLL